MQSTDVIAMLTRAFSLDGMTADKDGNTVYEFSSDLHFIATDLDVDTIRLCTGLHNPGISLNEATLRRMAEAGYLGAETGPGTVATDPRGGAALAYVDTFDVSGMDEDAVQERVVDFVLYSEYLRSEVLAALIERVDGDTKGSSNEDTVIRA